MTCIVGIVDTKNKNVLIGGDSAAVSNSNIFVRKDVKVFKNGDFVIGCTTSFRMIQLLRFSFKPPEINSKDIYQYMCTDFINAVRECFNEGGYLQKYDAGDEMGGTFLVGYKNKLFKIEDDFHVAENISGIDACGSGKDFALGVLHSLHNVNISTQDKILKALETTEFLANDVRRPFTIIKT